MPDDHVPGCAVARHDKAIVHKAEGKADGCSVAFEASKEDDLDVAVVGVFAHEKMLIKKTPGRVGTKAFEQAFQGF